MRLQVERVGFAILSFILALNFDVVERGGTELECGDGGGVSDAGKSVAGRSQLHG